MNQLERVAGQKGPDPVKTVTRGGTVAAFEPAAEHWFKTCRRWRLALIDQRIDHNFAVESQQPFTFD